ncbi:MAG: hypothetical protein ACYTCU_03965 [Planctomycetota bacterium]|jgi:hypothetical protein
MNRDQPVRVFGSARWLRAWSLRGGLLVPHADVLVPLPIPASGTLNLDATWPSLSPPWWSVWLQTWTQHASGPQGWIASNALRAVGSP